MQCINRDQTRIEWCQFECFGLKILITRGLVVIIGDFKSENSILTNLAPINWSIFWIKIITSHYTFFVVHQKLRNNKLEDGFVMNWHTIFGILYAAYTVYERSCVWIEMQQWSKSTQQEDIKMIPICLVETQ